MSIYLRIYSWDKYLDQSLLDLSLTIVKWWREAQYMTASTGDDDDNVFDEPPEFVRTAYAIAIHTFLNAYTGDTPVKDLQVYLGYDLSESPDYVSLDIKSLYKNWLDRNSPPSPEVRTVAEAVIRESVPFRIARSIFPE